LQKIFETLVSSYIQHQVGIADNFLNQSLANLLKSHLLSLHTDKLLLAAGTGNKAMLSHDLLVKSDKIYWLDKLHNNEHEKLFFVLLDEFITYLNSTCFTGITGYEFHYAIYEKGSFYKKHIDQFQNNKDRAFSMIIYLNDTWINSDGGELCLHHNKHDIQKINPISGKCIFFNSNEMLHEVLETQVPRLSITGWLKTN